MGQFPRVDEFGQPIRPVENYTHARELGFVQLTSFAAAAGLGDIPAGSRWAFIEVEGQPVRWRADGSNPTVTVGHVLNPGDVLPYSGSDLTKFKAIETAAGAKLNVSFYG